MKTITRFHKDGCQHGPECYVGSFEYVLSPKAPLERYDVYVYECTDGQEVCLRYGSRAWEYLSPGPVCQFLQSSSQYERYRKAVELLRKKGMFGWKRK